MKPHSYQSIVHVLTDAVVSQSVSGHIRVKFKDLNLNKATQESLKEHGISLGRVADTLNSLSDDSADKEKLLTTSHLSDIEQTLCHLILSLMQPPPYFTDKVSCDSTVYRSTDVATASW